MGYFEQEMHDILEVLKKDLKNALTEEERRYIEEQITAQENMLLNMNF